MLSGATTVLADIPDDRIYSEHKADTATKIEEADPLRPDRGRENDFIVEQNCFAFSPGQLNKFLDPKSPAAFKAVGGMLGLEKGLRTSLTAGLSADEGNLDGCVSFQEATAVATRDYKEHNISQTLPAQSSGSTTAGPGTFVDRKRVYGDNSLPSKKAKSIFRLMWEQYNDKILILLTIAAVISLALGLYESLGVKHAPGTPPPVDWIEGVAICVAIVIVVFVGSINDWQKERQFVKLNAKKEDREVKAIRSGKSVQINVHDILVGDVLHLEPGDMIPADGVFIEGHNVKCDESSATGESDQMKKTPGEEVFRRLENGSASEKLDPFLVSGSKVLEGVGTYLVTSTGVNSSFGKLMVSLHQEVEPTPLQVKLSGLADAIAYLGGGAAILLFSVLFFRFCANLASDNRLPAEKGSAFLDILIVAITLIVVAIPEGLPLAVTLALAFATTRMLKENNLVRVLRACETMGNATTVCSDKTGTLTQNKMTVVAGTISKDAKFFSGAEKAEPPAKVVSTFSKAVKDLLMKSITINSTAFEGEEDGAATFIGSKTETAMLAFARDFLGMGSLKAERSSVSVVQMIPFDSARKCMGAVIRLPSGVHRLLVKGASEILLSKATRRVADVTSEEIVDTELTSADNKELEDRINFYAERSLRTIGMLYKDYTQWPPIGAKTLEENSGHADFDDIFNEMVFLGVVGIQDPLRPGVTEAVKQCQDAGVVVRMVTGDNMVTAQAIASECGIFTEGGVVMEGPKFRQLSEEDMDAVLPKLQVLARSSPEDKRILVSRLKELGETVAVTGDGTNDGPALKTADVGFSMGIAGTEVAKEASSIILMDDNFASIIKAIMWGRAVNDAVQKFLQFQLTVNITAVLLTFVSAVSSPTMDSVLTAVQLLWVNLIMDTFAALALATDAPTPAILNRKPSPKSAPLISVNMWKMIIGQAIFQLIPTFVLHFAGQKIFPSWTPLELDTVVFNCFVWMQIFNEFNNRRLDNNFNIFEGITKNYFFMGINAIMIGGQIMIIFVGKTAFSITPLNGAQWAVSIVVALFCLPWAVLIRCIPDEQVLRLWQGLAKVFGPFVNAVVKGYQSMVRALPWKKAAKKKAAEETAIGEASAENNTANSWPV
ncbi:calcium-translocating P-type ATPase [Sphaerosporella brunnea]|uniref:Calcium-transporting ATPase n=1 Tax=Sphaerosporella brunnea TaxID=1250544 RepID=A0A5J5EM95_9PEZI|nr:calcium-translocating P-type ATPase [Sphaerosporella brunnea]